MEQSYKKRPPRATANSPLVLADMGGGKLFYKSGKFFKNQTQTSIYLNIPIRHCLKQGRDKYLQ